MSYLVLARKWRPKKFQEVIGQTHVTKSLQNAILKNKIGHAYMMVGTRGVGKTSLARIFAKAIRCENITPDINACGVCRACLDFDTETSMNVIEIDGASNNSVDNIRELIGNVHYLPTSGKYKVYIIDEVHMLSTNAFNALLKTLEEPPAHVVFIFATTEGQKLLGTVLSRCQRYDFRNVSVENLVSHIKEISQVEKIKFEQEELITQLAHLGKGSVRDTLSLLDQVLTFSEDNFVTESNFTTSLGVAGPKAINSLLNSILNGKTSDLSQIYLRLLNENVPVKNIASSILDEVYGMVKISSKEYTQAEIIWIFETIARETPWIFSSIAAEKAFEVLLYKVALRKTFFNKKIMNGQSVKDISTETEVHEVSVTKPTVSETLGQLMKELSLESSEIEQSTKLQEAQVKIESPVATIATGPKDLSWEGFLNDLGTRSPASASNLEQGNLLSPLRLEQDRLNLELGFGFSGQVFLDYLMEPEVFQKLLSNLSEYYNIEKTNIQVSLRQVSSAEDFVSQADIKEQKAQITLQDRVDEFKSNPLLKEAEKIFNSKVDKVILDQKK